MAAEGMQVTTENVQGQKREIQFPELQLANTFFVTAGVKALHRNRILEGSG